MKKLFSVFGVTIHQGDVSVLVLGFILGVVGNLVAQWLWDKYHGESGS